MKTKRKPTRSELQTERQARRVKNSPVIPANRPVAHLPQPADVMGAAFLESYAWRRLRVIALGYYGPKCMCCGATPDSGAVMNVDHIKPRKVFPQLALNLDNLQVLCHPCNHGKGNWDMTDWRPERFKSFNKQSKR